MLFRGLRSFSTKVLDIEAGGEGTRTYWNKVADWYLKYNYDLSNKVYESMTPFLHLDRATSILDAGCGAGNGISILKQHMATTAQFTMIDISDALIAKAKAAHPDVQALRENAESLSFKTDAFDAYVANGLIEIVTNPEWVLNEAFRVLKPGGRMAFSIYGRMGICNTLRLYKNIRNRLNPTMKTNEPRFELSDPERVISLTKDVGFIDTVYFYKQFHFAELNPEDIYRIYYDNPVLRELAEHQNAEKAFESIIYEELEYILYEKEEPLTYEALVIVGSKPNN